MSLATQTDVAARLGRALNGGEIAQIEAYLEDAEAAILSKLPTILVAAETDNVLRQNLISVECSVALRAARITDSVNAAFPNIETLTTPLANRANVTVLQTEWRKLGMVWYTAFSMSQNKAALSPSGEPGLFPDRNPGWGPWWTYAIQED